MYNKSIVKSILETRQEVRKSDMNLLINSNISFSYAGLFQSKGEWIHPSRVEKTYEIIYVTSGEVHMIEELSVGQCEICAKKGELFLLSPNLLHYGSDITSDVSFYWLHFSVNSGELPFEKRFFESFEPSYLFKELLHYNNLPSIPEYMVNSVLVRILSELCKISDGSYFADFDVKAEKIYEWIRINATAKLKVSQISEYFGYSNDHISRICKRYFKMTSKELINSFLMSKAKSALLNTDKYVKEIADELGFSDDKGFIAYFKYHEGCFPSEFRKRYGKTHMNSR